MTLRARCNELTGVETGLPEIMRELDCGTSSALGLIKRAVGVSVQVIDCHPGPGPGRDSDACGKGDSLAGERDADSLAKPLRNHRRLVLIGSG